MKRFRRWLFNGFAALSLFLFTATVAMWVRSYFYYDTEPLAWRHAVSFESMYGHVDIGWHKENTNGYVAAEHSSLAGDNLWSHVDLWKHAVWHAAGLGYLRWDLQSKKYPAIMFRAVRFSYWLPTVAFMLLPVYCAVRWQNWKRLIALGRFTSCGYDLRATPDRCPECGKTVEKTI